MSIRVNEILHTVHFYKIIFTKLLEVVFFNIASTLSKLFTTYSEVFVNWNAQGSF